MRLARPGTNPYRQIIALGHECQVVAPSLIPKRPGDRVKTNRRDAASLARPHRAGEVTAVWVPDEAHEAVRDLVRARESAHEALKKARQQLQSFLLRHGRIYPGRTSCTRAHFRRLAAQSFTHPAHHIVLAEYIQAIEDAGVREDRLTKEVVEIAASWLMAPVVEAYQAMRGIAFITAVTFVAEIGDIRRFETAPQLMAYLGLVPSESSTGERVKRGGITKAGNKRARRVLIEGAWTYRYPARVSPTIQARLEGLPRSVREIAWKGQIRLCARYRKLITAGKLKTVAVTAIAREMAAFLWAIGQSLADVAEAQARHASGAVGRIYRGLARRLPVLCVFRKFPDTDFGNSRTVISGGNEVCFSGAPEWH